jgi:hypothetical protein
MLSAPELSTYSHVEFRTLVTLEDAGTQVMTTGGDDIIFASGLSEHEKSVDSALRSIRSLLREGGRLILYELTKTESLQAGFIKPLFQPRLNP